MLIDTHCHLHDRNFFSNQEAIDSLKRATENGVEKIICIGTNLEDSLAAKDFAESHKNIYWTLGIHPEEANHQPNLDKISKINHEPIAIGEIGLDYHYSKENRQAQIKLFESLLQLAKEKNLPVSFHVREAFDDFFGIIKNFPEIKGVIHSFADSKKTLKKALEETDFYIGVNGLATYSTLPLPPLDRILLETDAPFLSPIPYRNEKNEPAHIKDIALWLAQKIDSSLENIAKTTTENAKKLYKI